MNTIISIKDLYKSYEDIEAVKGISFDIAEGEMFGLVGPDGAGKTTTIRILCGLIKPDSGSVTMIGKDILLNKKEIQNQIGYLSQKFSLYGDLSIDENIEFFADIHGVKDYKKRRNELLEFTRLKSFRERTAEKLSGGMKQKLALACSLIHKPKIIFLDEPTTGVDPVSRRDFWKILSSLLREKITIMLTTPYLDEAERCSRVAMMNNGEIISLDKPKNMKSELGKEIVEIVCDRVREAYRLIRDKLNLEVQLFGDRITVFVDSYQKDFPAVKNLLIENSIEISQARVISASLENIFIYLVRKAG
jgi:ABC-2 type transport system ATP-binding protein